MKCPPPLTTQTRGRYDAEDISQGKHPIEVWLSLQPFARTITLQARFFRESNRAQEEGTAALK
jgi:hypothetical protein